MISCLKQKGVLNYKKAISQQVWSPFSPSGGNSSAPGDWRKGGTTGRRKRTQTKARVGGISRASAQFDEVGLIEAPLILSQEFQVVGDGGGESGSVRSRVLSMVMFLFLSVKERLWWLSLNSHTINASSLLECSGVGATSDIPGSPRAL